jgi:hypothetical protein
MWELDLLRTHIMIVNEMDRLNTVGYSRSKPEDCSGVSCKILLASGEGDFLFAETFRADLVAMALKRQESDPHSVGGESTRELGQVQHILTSKILRF